jgi:hypothetical protein
MATFSLPSPVGATIPRLPIPDHFGVINAALTQPAREAPLPAEVATEPTVNRKGKADRLAPAASATVQLLAPRKRGPETGSIADEAQLAVIDVEPFEGSIEFAGVIARAIDPTPSAGALVRVPHLFFGADAAELPPLAFEHAAESPVVRLRLAALPGASMNDATTIASKGVVTGDDKTPKSPAERLALAGVKRTKAEKCLADAIYFESRGEIERGQIAVAQVVINRVFSGFYPEDVCGTVYQNAHRYLACQFTFACEGKKLVVNDQMAWERATRISREMLDGKLWLADVGKATHYHAYWVKPDWIREMRTIKRIGVHTFYRPRAWEDG